MSETNDEILARQKETMMHAEHLRIAHNGIMTVTLHLGHDGNNVCELRDYGGVIGRGETSVSLKEAINRAEREWTLRRFWKRNKIEEIAHFAAILFAGSPAKNDGVFQTAHFQTEIRTLSSVDIDSETACELLKSSPRIVGLSGGCTWLLLPNNYSREI